MEHLCKNDISGGSGPDRSDSARFAYCAHILPFAFWIFVILVFQAAEVIGCPLPRTWAAPAYAFKSVICAGLLFWLKPWRYYRSATVRSGGIVTGLIAGILVAALWIIPETPWVFNRAGCVSLFYNKWLIMPPGTFPEYFRPENFPLLPTSHPSLAYAPEECGPVLTVAKLFGSAFVISVAEEYFFRGFLYRWLRKGDFLSIPVAKYDAQVFWMVVLVFGLEHDRWLLGMVAGAVYGWTVLRTGRILPAVIAHSVTNLLLGVYVIFSHQYGFW